LKTAGSGFIALSKCKDKYGEYFTVMEAFERYNKEECGSSGRCVGERGEWQGRQRDREVLPSARRLPYKAQSSGAVWFPSCSNKRHIKLVHIPVHK
jgi:hypothetical protein